MADANDNSGLKPDDIIGRVVPQGGNPDVKTLIGVFLGESARPGYWRLYTSINLDLYFEFPKENALGAERFPSHQIVVWLKPETRVNVMTSTSAPVDFLQGKLASRHLSGRIFLPVGGGGLGGLGGCGGGKTSQDDENCHRSPGGPDCIPRSYPDNPSCQPA